MGDHEISTNSTPFSPPFDCQVEQIQFSSGINGDVSNKIISEIRCHEMDYDEARNIYTTDPLAWYASNQSGVTRESGYGRTWEYNNLAENDFMYKNKKYGLRVKHVSGTKYPNDVVVQVSVREI